MNDGPPFRTPCHLGVATCRLNDAMEALARQFDLTWNDRKHINAEFATSSGRERWKVQRVHSTGGPMRIELLEGSAGSVWQTTRLAALHHYAYWSDDLLADAEALRRQGWELEVTRWGEGAGPQGFAYFVRADSPRIELIAR